MNRITLEEVVEAYKKTGLKPKKFITREGNYACPIGAIYGLEPREQASPYIWGGQEYGIGYRNGFMSGFDGFRYQEGEVRKFYPFQEIKERYQEGEEDGEAIARAIFLDGILDKESEE